MALWDKVSQFFALQPWEEPELQTRSNGDDSSIADLMARFNVRGTVWRPAGVKEALGVPAIYAAVSIISNTVGSLTLRAIRNGVTLDDADRPRIVVRPNPFSTPRDFFRDTAWSMATRGEAWWWIAARDFDDSPLSVLPVNPAEIVVTEDERDLRFPIIEWRGRKMRNEDMRQLTLVREPGALRGVGPLQLCGAAVSVAVESQDFAANFYAEGGYPETVIKHATFLDPTRRNDLLEPDPTGQSEAERLIDQWTNGKANNIPRVIDSNIDSINHHPPDVAGVQMLDARSRTDVEAAQMFNMPAPMIEAAVAGGSLTYQNIQSLFDSFVRRCLRPNYLEPMEQAMSDLLTRSTVARFNTNALLQDNEKTRWEIYEIAGKVIGVDQAAEIAQQREGIVAGDIENAPVPLSPPQAIPASLPIQERSMREVRCHRCARLVGRVEGRAELFCRHCKEPVAA